MELRRRREEVSYDERHKTSDKPESVKSTAATKRKRAKKQRAKLKEVSTIMKYLYPIQAFRVLGDFCLPDVSSVDQYHGMSTYSYFKTIRHITCDDINGLLKIHFNPVLLSSYQVPWQYVVERYISMGDSDTIKPVSYTHLTLPTIYSV
eukprot:TRINITY_DN20183_c0_g1_i1.p1 TRINITY_DN20183_c0_g1~~TRINITY_DN20183_c0_g1_i1.p1  ORF type:complete len:149 (+),score=0.26 TRINITY_DN20183_c0_g1_i1:121-567(+)